MRGGLLQIGIFVATSVLTGQELAHAQQTVATGVKVPDSVTAVNLAEKALVKAYGKTLIESEKPLIAFLSNGVWHVSGTLYCKDKDGNLITSTCIGGVAMADIRQRDGRVLRTGHTE